MNTIYIAIKKKLRTWLRLEDKGQITEALGSALEFDILRYLKPLLKERVHYLYCLVGIFQMSLFFINISQHLNSLFI